MGEPLLETITVNVNRTLVSVDRLEYVIRKGAKEAVKNGAADLKREIKSTITDQKGSWPPLNKATLAAKAPETRILIDSGDMVGSISIKPGEDDYTKTIGVHGDRSESKRAARNEFGDPATNIPERSFVRSTGERVRSQTISKMKSVIQKNLY